MDNRFISSPAQRDRSPRAKILFASVILLAGVGVALALHRTGRPQMELAERAVAKGRLTEAVAHFESHLRDHPGDRAAQLALGNLWKRAAPDRALALLEAIPGDAAEYLPAQRLVAEVALAQADRPRAESALSTIVKTDPDDLASRIALARLLQRAGRQKEALPHVLRATEIDPHTLEPWLLLAEVYDDLHRSSEMIPALRRALELEPDHAEARLNLCYALVWSGEAEAARVEAEWCLARDPENVAARRFLAMCDRDEGEPERALTEIQRALKSAPDDLECRLVEAQLLLFLRQPEEALRGLRPLLPRYGKDRRLLTQLSRAAAATGQRDLAAEYQKRSEQLSSRGAPAPDSP